MDWTAHADSNNNHSMGKFHEEIEMKKHKPEAWFLQGDQLVGSGIPTGAYNGGSIVANGSGEVDQNQNYDVQQDKDQELNGEIEQLEHKLKRTCIKPNPLVDSQDDSQEKSMLTHKARGHRRGGLNRTTRGGGPRAYKFGANRNGNDELLSLRYTAHRQKYYPSTPTRVSNKRGRSPNMTDELLEAYRRQRNPIPSTNKIDWKCRLFAD